MTNSTKDYSDSQAEKGEIVNSNVENPHANLELTEEELDEIYSRPYMN